MVFVKLGPGKEVQMKRTGERATPELGSRKMRFLSTEGNFFLNTTLQNGVTDYFSINIREGFMWQQRLSHSWNHIFSEAQCLRLLHCTLGDVVENNMLDFFVSSLALQIPGHAVWGHLF